MQSAIRTVSWAEMLVKDQPLRLAVVSVSLHIVISRLMEAVPPLRR
jgi:hypothetical protein